MNKLIIFTDGACKYNGKPYAKAGCGVFYPNKEYSNIAIKFDIKPITNQRAELYAIYLALHDKQDNNITIYTDSLYSIKCLTKWMPKWKQNGMRGANNQPIKNQDILSKLNAILCTKSVVFKHVNSHMTNINDINQVINDTNINELKYICNNVADKLANDGLKS